MKLFVEDLDKAIAQTPNVGQTTKPSKQSTREYNESFSKQPVGVAPGSVARPDDPDKGKKWKHDDSLEDELEEERQKQNAEAQERNLVPKKEETTVKKSLNVGATDVLKSLNGVLEDRIRAMRPSDSEIDFLVQVKGCSLEAINKGQVFITGADRTEFHEWLNSRLTKSLKSLRGL